jgi:uncharacterized membrane protein
LNRIPSQEGAIAKVSLATERGEAVNGIRVLESLSESFIVVPPELLPETRYHGNVTIELNPHVIIGEPEVVNDPLNFTTLAFPNHATINSVMATPSTTGSGGTVNVYVSLNADPHATVAVSAPSFTAAQALSATPGQNVSFALPVNGPGEACLNSPPHDGYASLHQCDGFNLAGHPNTGGGTTHGGSGETSQREQQLRALASCLRATAALRLKSLRRHKLLTLSCRALTPGVLTIRWYASVAHRAATHKPSAVEIADARVVFTSPRVAELRMKLNHDGLAILRRVSGRLRMVGKATFALSGSLAMSTSATVALRP